MRMRKKHLRFIYANKEYFAKILAFVLWPSRRIFVLIVADTVQLENSLRSLQVYDLIRSPPASAYINVFISKYFCVFMKLHFHYIAIRISQIDKKILPERRCNKLCFLSNLMNVESVWLLWSVWEELYERWRYVKVFIKRRRKVVNWIKKDEPCL